MIVTELMSAVQAYFYKIIVGVVVLLLGFGMGILAKKLAQKILKEIELNKIMSKVGVTHDLEKWIGSIIAFMFYFATIILFLDRFNIVPVVVYIIIGAILMLVILTFLVGIKDIIPNFMGWLFIQRKSKLKEGYKIELKEISGIIEKIGYLETEIKTEKGDLLYVPNALFIKSKHLLRK